MSTTLSAVQLYAERSALVASELERRPYLTIHDVMATIGKSISIARQLVREMEASGQLVIVAQGWRRFYYRHPPTPEQLPKREIELRPRPEKPTMVFLRSGADRHGNTRCDECRSADSVHQQLNRLLSVRLQAA